MNAPVLEPLLGRLFGHPAPAVELVKLQGDASSRQYYRARATGAGPDVPPSMIVMQLPSDAPRSDEGGPQPDTKRLPFLEVGELLAERGVPVPKIYGEDLERGLLLLEDLGDQTLYSVLTDASASSWSEHYERAVDLLADLHERCEALRESSIVRRRCFDRALLEWELDHFREWGLEALFGNRSAAEHAAIDEAFKAIVDAIEDMPVGFVHRDYQSKNLMVSDSGSLTLIDYQDAMIGPRVYDLVALLCDSYVSIEPDLQAAMIARYAAMRRIDSDELKSEFRWVTLHRKLKDAGRFVFIDRVRRNPDFLQWFPQSFVYIGRAVAETPELATFAELLTTAIPGFPDAVQKPTSALK